VVPTICCGVALTPQRCCACSGLATMVELAAAEGDQRRKFLSLKHTQHRTSATRSAVLTDSSLHLAICRNTLCLLTCRTAVSPRQQTS
jgi:hypothetical protein